MRLNPDYSEEYTHYPFESIEASLQSSDSIGAILECARERFKDKTITREQFERIETICSDYEKHQKQVRDHCLDLKEIGQFQRFSESSDLLTHFLMQRGKHLLDDLTEAVLTF